MRSVIQLTLLCVALSACGGQGDFGRKPYSVLDDKILPAIKRGAAEAGGNPLSSYPLTYAEQQMRNSSGLLVTPYIKKGLSERLISHVAHVDFTGARVSKNAPEHYLSRLKREKFADGSTRTSFIANHIYEDTANFKAFKRHVERVIAADARRRTSIRRNDDLGADEQANARLRISENREVVHKTLKELDLRMRGYDKALRATLLPYPDVKIGKTGSRLHHMKNQIDAFAARMRPYLAGSGQSV